MEYPSNFAEELKDDSIDSQENQGFAKTIMSVSFYG